VATARAGAVLGSFYLCPLTLLNREAPEVVEFIVLRVHPSKDVHFVPEDYPSEIYSRRRSGGLWV